MLVMPTINMIDTHKNITIVVISGMIDAAINQIKAYKSNFICSLSSIKDGRDLTSWAVPCQRLPVLQHCRRWLN